MTSLVEFIEARLSEDEQSARAAAARASDWHSSKGNVGGGGEYTDLGDPDEKPYWHDDEVIVYDEGWPLAVEATHIARHDPARVLREVDAEVALIVEFANSGCLSCSSLSGGEDLASVVLGTLASVYSDHPDYDPAWART